MVNLGTSGGSRNSARAGNAPGAGGTGAATAAAPAGGKKGAAGGKDKGADDKAAGKQQGQAPATSSMAELQGKLSSFTHSLTAIKLQKNHYPIGLLVSCLPVRWKRLLIFKKVLEDIYKDEFSLLVHRVLKKICSFNAYYNRP